MTINLSALVLALLGLALYVLTTGKPSTSGLVAYAVGLFWFAAKLSAGGISVH